MKYAELVETTDQRRIYRGGMCDAMALALHDLTRLPLGLWRGFFPDEFGEAGDEGYEDCHAVVVLSFDPPRWVDVDGVHDGEPDNCQFGQPVTRLQLVPASKRDVREAFTVEHFKPAIVRQAKQFITADPALSRLIASLTEARLVESADAIERIHLAAHPLGSLMTVTYPQQIGRKPNGFWWGIGTSWMDFAPTSKARGAKARSKGIPYRVDLGGASIIRLTDWNSILAFTVKYGCTYAPRGLFFWQSGDQTHYDPQQDVHLTRANHCRVPAIRWDRVAADYDGIELPSYRRAQGRPSMEWLEIDWDVSSGCAWNLQDVTVHPVAGDEHSMPAASK